MASVKVEASSASGRGVLTANSLAQRLLLIILILGAFLRLTWQLGAKNLWWDESLTLQRVESPLPALLLGQIVLTDGQNLNPTLDQHPFLFFVLERIGVTLAGQSEFVLRFPALMAAILLVPMIWAFARLLVRRRVLPPAAPIWAALLAAVNPFYLWYGQEARAYTLAPLLVLLSTYLLLRAIERSQNGKPFLGFAIAYVVALLALLATHYLVVLILPIQLVLILVYLLRAPNVHSRRAGLILSGAIFSGLFVVVAVVLLILHRPDSGTNFGSISLKILVPDLLNAFSLGLSVNIEQVRWLDYTFAALAILGVFWSLRPKRGIPAEAWLLPGMVITPVLGLQLIQLIQPAYMNARHMSFISGAFLLLVAGGLAWAWQWRRWAGTGLALLLIAGSAYSTYNYFTVPEYDKDNFARVGNDLRQQIQPGDAVVVVPSEMLRLYRYYLPLDDLATAQANGLPAVWQAFPLYGHGLPEIEQRFSELASQYRRIWLVNSGMVPLNPLRKPALEWLPAHAFQVLDYGYHANTLLKLRLFLPQVPALDELPANVQVPLNVAFGDQIRLLGYEVGRPLLADSAIPVTLYWQASQPIGQHYKYILRLVADDGQGKEQILAHTEREPYDGALPTSKWQPGQVIREYSALVRPEGDAARRSVPWPPDPRSGLHLTLQVYDAETQAKLSLTGGEPGQVAADGQTLILPYVPQNAG
jgi:mannosyltransferase